MSQLDLITGDITQLLQENWTMQLQEQTRQGDIFSDLAGLFVEGSRTLPTGIVMRLPFRKGIYRHTIGLLMDLSGDGVNGRTDQEGNEETQDLKFFVAYSNDYSHAVNSQQYGIDKHTKDAYNILSSVTKQLGTWHKQKAGLKMRQALLELVDDDLTVSPTSQTQGLNKNFFLKGIDIDTEQPVYDSTLVDYVNNIGDAAELAGVTDWDVTFMNNILFYARATVELEPYIDGRYAVTVPAFEATPLKDVGTTGSMWDLKRDTFVQEIAGEAWKNSYLGTYQNIDLFEDSASPMMTFAGSTGSWAATTYYKKMGSTDDRPSSGVRYDVGNLCGKSAIVWAEHEATHMEDDPQNYGKRKGIGAFRGAGANALEFDVGTKTDTSRRNQSSAILLTKRVARNA
jgi:hypothetical protein